VKESSGGRASASQAVDLVNVPGCANTSRDIYDIVVNHPALSPTRIAEKSVGEMEVVVEQHIREGDSIVEKSTPPGGEMSSSSKSPEGDVTSDIETPVICQLKSESLFSLEVQVGELMVEAVVDTAAQVSIISDRVFQRLKKSPPKLRDVSLLTAGRKMTMRSFVVGPVKMKIGTQKLELQLYVAPIEQDMLLGQDILYIHGSSIVNMRENTLTFGDQVLELNVGLDMPSSHVSRVTVVKRRVIPPNSVTRVKCKLKGNVSTYMIEPVQGLKVLVPRTLHADDVQPTICVVNTSNKYRILKKGTQVAKAVPVDEVVKEELQEEGRVCMSTEETGTGQNSQSAIKGTTGITNEDRKTLPPHLKDMYEASTKCLDPQQCDQLASVLIEYQDVFAKTDFDLGTFTDIEHGIDTSDARPVKERMRRTPAGFSTEEEGHLKKMLEAGVIRESASEWASCPVLIRKRDGSVRWCIDYRALNNVTVKDVFPLPLVDDCLDTLAGSLWFSKLDANSAYWQIKIKEEDCKKTAFLTKYGLYEHVRMGFGLCNAPATFARVMNLVLRGLHWKILLAFLDDILILGASFEDHLINLVEALKRLQQYGLKLKPRKCVFFQQEVEFLGRMVSQNNLAMKLEDSKAVREWPTPQNSKDVERFMGLANYHRGFVKEFSKLADPLYTVIGKNKFKWDDAQQIAFSAIKEALTKPPILALPNLEDHFILDTDASDVAIGAELIQCQNNEERVVAYGSYALTHEQRRYCVTRRELLAVVRFTRQWRHYLLGRPFVLRTDHSSLTWLLRFKAPQGQLARWIEELSQYNMIVKHRAGVKHGNADALSRRRVSVEEYPACEAGERPTGWCSDFRVGVRPADLPCGGCHYCKKADAQWGTFFRDVDEAVPLTLAGKHDEFAVRANAVNTVPSMTGAAGGRRGRQWIWDSAIDVTTQAPKWSLHWIPDDVGQYSCQMVLNDQVPAEYEHIASEQYVLPWESEGLREGDNGVTHLDIAIEGDGDISVLSCGVSSVQAVDLVSKPTCWGYTLDDLQKAQAEDEDLESLLAWVKDSTAVPSRNDLFRSGPAAKTYWLNKEVFELIDGVLYKIRKTTMERDLVMPSSLKRSAIEYNHELPSSGHQGIARTKAKLREKFYWYGLKDDVAKFVTSCDVCNKNKKLDRYGRCPLIEYQAGAPMERVHIDFMGPLPVTPRGNEHILMIVDQFTKWVECFPLPSQTAEVTARAAVNGFFSRFGYPFEIFSDQGRNFESKLFTAMCEALHIHKTRTTPYRPSANGQVERHNRTLMDAVRCFIGNSQDQWDLNLHQIAGALRASVNRSTGYTPNKMMLGREVNSPAYLMFPQVGRQHLDPDSYVAEHTSTLGDAHQKARAMLKTTSRRMKRNYDLRILERPYKQGDLVYILDSATVKGKCRKLCSPWKGPGVIAKKISAYLYRIKLQNAIFVANHDRMKPCRDEKIPAWIRKWQEDPADHDEPVSEDGALYCLCRKPCDGRFMIQCDFCDGWYHGSCINLSASEALYIDRYKCEGCSDKSRVAGAASSI
jgi:transposase InsO family protein